MIFNIKNIFYFLAALILMYFGYFYKFTEVRFIFFNLALFLWVTSFFISFRSDYDQLLIFYLLVQFLFPKKALNFFFPVLFNVGFDSLGDDTFNFFDFISVLIVLAISFNVLIDKIKIVNKDFKRIRDLFFIVLISSLFGIVYSIIFFYENQSYSILKILFGVNQLFSAVILIYIFSRTDFQKIFKSFISLSFIGGILIILEFILVKYSGLAPQFITQYSFDYRGGFRSFLQSTTLNTGVYLFIGQLSAIYLFTTRKKYFYLYLALIMSAINFFTYERVLVVLSFFAFVFILFNKSKKLLIVSSLLLITLSLLDLNITSSVEKLDISQKKEEGFFGTGSTLTRWATNLRAIDLFVASPLFGVGISNSIEFTNSPKIPPVISNELLTNNLVRNFYYEIANGRRTMPHSYYFSLISDLGVFGFLLIFCLLLILFSTSQKHLNNSSSDIAIYSRTFIYSIAFYYLFQPYPVMLNLIIINYMFYKTTQF